MSPASLRDYEATCRLLERAFPDRIVESLEPDDFARLRSELAANRGPVSVGNEITRVRVVFKFAFDNFLIDRPVRYGTAFQKPSKRLLRLEKARRSPKLFQPDEIRRLIGLASIQMRAMIYLGVNCGFGPGDCGRLNWSAIDFDSGWVVFPRPKTGIHREVPLWDETVAALGAVQSETGDGQRVFTTRFNRPWTNSAIAHEFRKLTIAIGARRECVGFYALRHTFATIASASLDQPAIDAIMGHCDPSMSAVYRQEIEDERLIRVVEFVRGRVLE